MLPEVKIKKLLMKIAIIIKYELTKWVGQPTKFTYLSLLNGTMKFDHIKWLITLTIK